MKHLALITSFFFLTLADALPGGIFPPKCPTVTLTVTKTIATTVEETKTATVTNTVEEIKTATVTTTVEETKAVPTTVEETKTATVTSTVEKTITATTTVESPVTVTVTSCTTTSEKAKPTECPYPRNWNKGLGDNSKCSDSCSYRKAAKNGEIITCEKAGPDCNKHCVKCKKHPECDGASDGDACDIGGYCRSGQCVWLVNKNQCNE